MIDPTKYEGHTPGPWHIGTTPPNGQQTIGTVNGLMVAIATHGIAMGNSTVANARLIAAAPALLAEVARLRANLAEAVDSLRRTAEQLERIGDSRPHKDGQFIDDARAVLAKHGGGK